MTVLSDDQLIEVYALNCNCEGTRVMLNGLRAVADAAVAADRAGRGEPSKMIVDRETFEELVDLAEEYSTQRCIVATSTERHLAELLPYVRAMLAPEPKC